MSWEYGIVSDIFSNFVRNVLGFHNAFLDIMGYLWTSVQYLLTGVPVLCCHILIHALMVSFMMKLRVKFTQLTVLLLICVAVQHWICCWKCKDSLYKIFLCYTVGVPHLRSIIGMDFLETYNSEVEVRIKRFRTANGIMNLYW